jgi:hypothetical protein
MPAVLTMKVHLNVNVMLGFLEVDLIVPVSKYFLHPSEILYLSANHILFVISMFFPRH